MCNPSIRLMCVRPCVRQYFHFQTRLCWLNLNLTRRWIPSKVVSVDSVVRLSIFSFQTLTQNNLDNLIPTPWQGYFQIGRIISVCWFVCQYYNFRGLIASDLTEIIHYSMTGT